jgi:hypothetical protein
VVVSVIRIPLGNNFQGFLYCGGSKYIQIVYSNNAFRSHRRFFEREEPWKVAVRKFPPESGLVCSLKKQH